MSEHASPPRRARFIDSGLVSCPVRGASSDLEACLRCTWLRSVDEEGEPRYIVCSPPMTSLPPIGMTTPRASVP